MTERRLNGMELKFAKEVVEIVREAALVAFHEKLEDDYRKFEAAATPSPKLP